AYDPTPPPTVVNSTVGSRRHGELVFAPFPAWDFDGAAGWTIVSSAPSTIRMIDSWIASFCDLSWFQLTMDATRLRRPERTQELVLLCFNTHLVAAFLLNISVFLTAVGLFFSLSGNYAGALAGVAVAMLTSLVGGRTLARDESVRMFGFVIAVGGLL